MTPRPTHPGTDGREGPTGPRPKPRRYRSLASQENSFPLATEALARRFHAVYQDEARRQAKQHADTIRHPDAYDELPEHTKDYDRALAMFVLYELLPATEAHRLEDTLRRLTP